jgi:hypothetical protein
MLISVPSGSFNQALPGFRNKAEQFQADSGKVFGFAAMIPTGS